jgi:hypothetical protein
MFVQPGAQRGGAAELPEGPITALVCAEQLAFIAGGRGPTAYLAAYSCASMTRIAVEEGGRCAKMQACSCLLVRRRARARAAAAAAACSLC